MTGLLGFVVCRLPNTYGTLSCLIALLVCACISYYVSVVFLNSYLLFQFYYLFWKGKQLYNIQELININNINSAIGTSVQRLKITE